MVLSAQDGHAVGKWKIILTAAPCLRSTGLMSSDAVTCKKLGKRIYRQWTSSQAGFPVKISRRRAEALGLKVPARASGRNLRVSFLNFDPITSLWKMCLACGAGVGEHGWVKWLGTWPRSAMIVSGIAFPLPSSERHIGVSDCSLWPTPMARDRFSDPPRRTGAPSLTTSYVRQRTWRGSNLGLAGQLNGALNPRWVEWLMGFPLGWTALKASAMPASRKSSR